MTCLGLLWPFGSPNVTAADWPLMIHEGTNVLRLPVGASEIWIARSFESATTFPISPRDDGAFEFRWPDRSVSDFAACRVKVKGQWQQIQQTVIEPSGAELWDEQKPGDPYRPHSWIGVLNTDKKRFALGKLPAGIFRSEVVANRLGSALDPVLRLLDSRGNEIEFSDDDVMTGRDSVLMINIVEEGEYTLELRDVAYGSGENFFYYLRARTDRGDGDRMRLVGRNWRFTPGRSKDGNDTAETAKMTILPYDGTSLFDRPGDKDWYAVEAKAGQRLVITAQTRKIGSLCDAGLSLFDPNEKVIAESVGSGTDEASITNHFKAGGKYRLLVREISGLGGNGLFYRLEIKDWTPGVVLSSDVERVDSSKEGEAKIKIACKRYDYDGPVKLEVEDGLPEGVSLSDSVIEKGKNEIEVKFKREKEVEAFQVRIRGTIEQKETKGTKELFPVSTMPALRKLYPLQMFPCAAMDGWIAVNPTAP